MAADGIAADDTAADDGADTAPASGEHGPPRSAPPLMAATWETAMSDPDPLTALGATRALTGLLSTWEAKLVGEAVAAGATWETIGGTVGVSRQAAWQRFHGQVHEHVHEFRDRVRADMQEMRHRHREEAVELRRRIRDEAQGIRGRGRGRRAH